MSFCEAFNGTTWQARRQVTATGSIWTAKRPNVKSATDLESVAVSEPGPVVDDDGRKEVVLEVGVRHAGARPDEAARLEVRRGAVPSLGEEPLHTRLKSSFGCSRFFPPQNM